MAALELLGFDAYLDKQDIAPGEPWEERLGNLIRLADTVVFVISPNSLASKHCAWEVEETARAGKRLVPVMLKQVADADVPERLRKLNYVFFTEGHSFSKSLSDLTRALRADAQWIREHSRYAELAARWNERQKPEALLLRGSDLDDARRWLAVRPADAPDILASQQDFIAASIAAADDDLKRKAALRWRTQIGLALASLVLAGLAVFALLQWRSAESAKAGLAESNARLERKLALRAAPLANQPYDVPAGWFQIATTYASAVAFVESAAEPGVIKASGVIVDARQLNAVWEDRPVFVTAAYVVAEGSARVATALPARDAVLVIFGPKGERQTMALAEVLWQSDEVGVSISTLVSPLPKDATMVTRVSARPAALDALIPLTWPEVDALFDEKEMLKAAEGLRPVIIVGNLQGRGEVALSVGHLLGMADANTVSSSRAGATTRATAVQPAPLQLQADLVYTHATLPGGGGSPVFDAATGDLIGIHLISLPCATVQPSGRRCAAGGVSLPRILAAIAAAPTNR